MKFRVTAVVHEIDEQSRDAANAHVTGDPSVPPSSDRQRARFLKAVAGCRDAGETLGVEVGNDRRVQLEYDTATGLLALVRPRGGRRKSPAKVKEVACAG